MNQQEYECKMAGRRLELAWAIELLGRIKSVVIDGTRYIKQDDLAATVETLEIRLDALEHEI